MQRFIQNPILRSLVRNLHIRSISNNTPTHNTTLYSKISSIGNPKFNLTPALDDWVQNGNRIFSGELKRIIHDFRRRSRFSQALQVSEWMSKKGYFSFTAIEHAVQLNLIGKVHGFVAAETYFNNLPEQYQSEKTYGALFHCYVRQRQTEKSLSHLQKMKEKGLYFSSLTYNDTMSLFMYLGEYEKVDQIFNLMKQNGVSPDNLSYKMCINSYGVKSDIDGIENLLNEMETNSEIVMDWNTYAVVANFYIKANLNEQAYDALEKAEKNMTNNNGIGYNHLITLYARLGQKDAILRLWRAQKSSCKKCINNDYIIVIISLAKLGELEDAEKIWEEWKVSGNVYYFMVPYALANGYINNKNYEKAEKFLEGLEKNGKIATPHIWDRVAEAFLKKGEMGKVVNCMKKGFSLCGESTKWKPNPKVVKCALSFLEKNGNETDEKFLGFLRNC